MSTTGPTTSTPPRWSGSGGDRHHGPLRRVRQPGDAGGKLLAGHSGYDVVVPTNEPTFSRLIRPARWPPIDRAQRAELEESRSGTDAAGRDIRSGKRARRDLPVGHHRLGVIPDRVKALAPDAPMDSWDLLFRPENARRIAPCGITMMDSAIDVIPGVLKYLGKSPDSTDPADLAAVERTLMGDPPLHPQLRLRRRAGGAGDRADLPRARLFRRRDPGGGARGGGEARRDRALRRAEGGRAARLRHARDPGGREHKDAALAFINFVLQPEVMAAITNKVRYANAVPASRPMIRPELLADTNIFPTPAQMATFFTIGPVPQAAERGSAPACGPRFKAGH